MFEKLRGAFREAVDNFYTELNRDDVPDNVDGLLRGMTSELVDARSQLAALREDVVNAERSLELERKAVATCRRREQLARDIQDEETAQVASDFAEKHERKAQVLEAKRAALTEEIRLLEEETVEMTRQIKEARTHREGLSAQVGRTSARETLNRSETLFQELDRMAEAVEDEEARIQAMEEVDERLREMKERMAGS